MRSSNHSQDVSPSALGLSRGYMQLMTELEAMLQQFNLMDADMVIAIRNQLAAWPSQLHALQVESKAAKSLANISNKLKLMRKNNLFAKLYRQILLHEHADLTQADELLLRIEYEWCNAINQACMKGLRLSHYAIDDASWWALFKDMDDHHVAAQVFIDFVYRRPLPRKASILNFSVKEQFVAMPADGFVTSPQSMHEFMHTVIDLCGGADHLIASNIRLNLMLHNAREQQFDINLNDIKIKLDEGVALSECLHLLNDTVESVFNFPDVIFRLLRQFVIIALYDKAQNENASIKQVLSDAKTAHLLLQCLKLHREHYLETPAIFLRSALGKRIKSKADLHVLIANVENPALLTNIMIDHLPQILKVMEYKGEVSADFNQLAHDLVQYASQLSFEEYHKVESLNRMTSILKELESYAKGGHNLAYMLTELRNDNIMLMLYLDLLKHDDCDWSQAATWLSRVYRVWNDCITAAALTGYRQSKYASSDHNWWQLFCITEDKLLAIAILKDFIYHRELDQSATNRLANLYNHKRVPIDNSEFPEKLSPPGLTNIQALALHVSKNTSWTDLEAVKRGNEINRAAAELRFKVNAAVKYATESNQAGPLAGALTAIELVRNRLYDKFKEECCSKYQNDSSEVAISELKYQLSEMQAPRILEVYHQHCSEVYLQPAVDELYAGLAPDLDLNQFITNLRHPRLLACFLEKFLARRQEQVARHRAALFTPPVVMDELPATENANNTFSSCRMDNAQPK